VKEGGDVAIWRLGKGQNGGMASLGKAME